LSAKKVKGSTTVFKITGNFKKGRKTQDFTKEVMSDNKQQLKEYIYSIIGSKHRVKRREITISKIEEIPIDKVTDQIILQRIGGK
jgi:large subunit ribosomal protein LX